MSVSWSRPQRDSPVLVFPNHLESLYQHETDRKSLERKHDHAQSQTAPGLRKLSTLQSSYLSVEDNPYLLAHPESIFSSRDCKPTFLGGTSSFLSSLYGICWSWCPEPVLTNRSPESINLSDWFMDEHVTLARPMRS